MKVAQAVTLLLASSLAGAFTFTSSNAGLQNSKAVTARKSQTSALFTSAETGTKPPLLATTELPSKLYFEKETPKVLGGLKIGTRELVVVTGASSGLGRKCAATLAKTGRYYVIMACRDVEKGKAGKAFFYDQY